MVSKASLRGLGRIVNALNGFVYDFTRYVLHSGWSKNLENESIRNYHAAKIYHALEKSMSFPNRNPESGWENAKLLLECCFAAQRSGRIGRHDRAAVAVLRQFACLPGNEERPEAKKLLEALEKLYSSDDEATGVLEVNSDDFSRGQLACPEAFFNSRYSVRDYSEDVVPLELIERAVSLAMKTPSACNRHPWSVYYTDDQKIRDEALIYQSGNRGFGHKIPMLLVVTCDLRAFMPGQERYQHWIDGGLFSMSLIYALHSLGLVSCCLNWSQSPAKDKQFRASFSIGAEETIIMMIAVGRPLQRNSVCVSGRRPMRAVLQKLTRVSDA